MNTKPLVISSCVFQNSQKYPDGKLSTYEIHYPQFTTAENGLPVTYLNDYYYEKAYVLASFSQKKECKQLYQLNQSYTVTYNAPPLLSLYYDQYFFTGGAHGSTTRYSNTWDTSSESILMLKDFFPGNANYKQDIIQAINLYISKEKESGDSSYYDDYKQNVASEFNENNFYIIPEGIVVYFQQYQIAPYSSGIPEFLIPVIK